MQNLVNKQEDIWIRPWDIEKFDDLYSRDERFFSILIKGVLSWLNSNLRMYGKPIKHFILNTGSAYMYLENNGYEYTWCETTGENMMYMETPRCLVKLGTFSIPTEELTCPYSNGVYERISTAEKTYGQIKSYNAQIRRLPIEMDLQLNYVFSNFNESVIFVQQLFEKIVFQKYFNIVYLGQTIKSSIEIEGNTEIKVNELDLSSTDPNRRTMDFNIKICTNMPCINIETETKTDLMFSKLYTDKQKDIKIKEIKQKIENLQNSTTDYNREEIASEIIKYEEAIKQIEEKTVSMIKTNLNEELGNYRI